MQNLFLKISLREINKQILLFMKKMFFVAIATFGFTFSSNAQNVDFGATAGYHNLIVRASADGISASDGASGFYFGLFADFSISDKFHIQPELQYASVSQDGGTGNEIIVPVMAKYYPAANFYLQAGPNFDLIIDDSEGVNDFGFGLAGGLGYDFTEKFFASARYSFGLSERLQEDIGFDVSTKFNFLQIGVGYKF